ncbi:MAG: hypothetical protein M1837_005948 [Sclerophora amabilis]|nr:MAG: hypothetical protein M1837_005948 [Sclerophora amabilis]
MDGEALPDQRYQQFPQRTNPLSAPSSSSPSNGPTQERSIVQGSEDAGLLSQFTSNPFFTAGFGLAGLGAALAFAQKGVRHGAALVKRRLLVDVEISRNDESYQWFLHWMSQYQKSQSSNAFALPPGGLAGQTSDLPKPSPIASLMRRITPGLHHLSIQTSKISHPNGSLHTHFSLIPGPGKHILRYKNTFLSINRSRETKLMNLQTGSPWETITLTTLYSQRHIFEELFTEAHRLAVRLQEGKTVVYTSWGTEWRPFGQPRRKRPLESVILDEGVKEKIMDDVRDFLQSGQWYYDRGIPYRRGYLLHGTPGSGKSSFIQALAGSLDYDISLLNLSERGLTDDRLNHLLTNVPARTIVLLEDVDAAFSNRRTQTDADGYQGANVTFSGLLNALDGVASAEERIIFLTTNHVERLDEALVRPGRVDMTVRLGEASTWQIGQLWDRFYGDVDTDGEGKRVFLDRLEELGMIGSGATQAATSKTSAAALQGLFLYNKGNMAGAISMAEGLIGPAANGASSSR